MDKPDLDRFYHWVAVDPDYREVNLTCVGAWRLPSYRMGDRGRTSATAWVHDYRLGVGGFVGQGEDIDQVLRECKRRQIMRQEIEIANWRAQEEGTG